MAHPHDNMNLQLGRIAALTSVIRTREEDARRAAHNGEREQRLTLVVERLEKIADELEKAA